MLYNLIFSGTVNNRKNGRSYLFHILQPGIYALDIARSNALLELANVYAKGDRNAFKADFWVEWDQNGTKEIN